MGDDVFAVQIPNGLKGDPLVYVPQRPLGEAFCFDLGSLEALAHKDLMRITHVFVSHTHMDHFIGFDRLLRVHLPHARLMKMWGPAPFIERVQAKLRAYTWNLIKPDQIRFLVHELKEDGSVTEALLTNTNNFAIQAFPSKSSIHKLCEWADGSSMRAALLDHKGIPSVAYKYLVPGRMRVLVEKMKDFGLEPGEWVGQLQARLRAHHQDDTLVIEGRSFSVRDLASKVIEWEAQRSFAYVTDASFDERNVKALFEAFGSSEQLISETSFLDKDFARALDKAHLTSRHAALLGRLLRVKKLHTFHFSAIYGEESEVLLQESQDIFQELQKADDSSFQAALQAEFLRIKS